MGGYPPHKSMPTGRKKLRFIKSEWHQPTKLEVSVVKEYMRLYNVLIEQGIDETVLVSMKTLLHYYNGMMNLRVAMSYQNEEICQIAGKALGYPYFKDDQKNFPGATEEHGVCVGEHICRTIVEELAEKYLQLKKEKNK